MWSNTRYVWCCFYFSVIQLCCRQTCCLKYSDRLSAMLKYDSTTQSLSFNSGSPCSSWVWCEWQLSGGGIHMKPFYQCCPLGSAWLTAAQCKSSAIMESYCCIYTGETSFFLCQTSSKRDLLCKSTDSEFIIFHLWQRRHFLHESKQNLRYLVCDFEQCCPSESTQGQLLWYIFVLKLWITNILDQYNIKS